jgi:hypothetical protein
MNSPQNLIITCACGKQKQFPYVLPVKEGTNAEPSEKISIQIDCPFFHEEYCLKKVSVELPKGMDPEKDSIILRDETSRL